MTTLTITPNWKNKSARFKGTIAAGEHVAVSIANDESYIADTTNLRLRVVNPANGKTLAQFPMPVEEGETPDEWDSDLTTLSCELDLNTVQMLMAVPPAANVPLLFVLDDYEGKTLFFKDFCEVTHWPRRVGEEPTNLDDYKDIIAEFREDIYGEGGFKDRVESAEESAAASASAATAAAESASGSQTSAASSASAAQGAAQAAAASATAAQTAASDAKAVGDKKVSKSGDTMTGKLKVNDAIENGHSTASATGTGAHAEGMDNVASGAYAHSEGFKTMATGIESHAEGYCSVASGHCAHAEGRSAQATGAQSHAEGYWTVAEGDRTHAEGVECCASSYYSHAEGAHSHADGPGCHAEGWCTHAQKTAAHATGTFANAKDNYSFVFSGVFQDGVERWTNTQRSMTPGTGSSDYPVPRQDVYPEGSIVVCHGYTFVAKKDVQPGVMPPVEGVKRDPTHTVYVYWKLAEGYESDENWLYLGQSKMYGSHGDGTFNVNPNGGSYLPAYGMYIGESRLPAVIAELMVNPSSTTPYPKFSESAAYSAGDFVVYNGFLYRFKNDHAAGAWRISDVTWFGVTTALSAYVNGGSYDSTNKKILLKNGSKTVAEIDATAFLCYDRAAETVIDTASQETVEGETVNYGEATLADRTGNRVSITAALDELRVTFPPAVSGKLRDFGLRVEVGTGSAALTAPALVPVAPTGETIKLENNAKQIPALADGTATAKGVTLLYFSESAPGVFFAKGEQVEEVA